MNKEAVLQFLNTNKELFCEQYGVIRIGLFGSYARNQQNTDSDIDLIVEFSSSKYEYSSNLKTFVESSLNSKTDIIRMGNHLSSTFINQLKSEVIYV